MREGTCGKRTGGNTGTAPAGLPHPGCRGSNQAQAPAELRAALATIARHVDDYAGRACLPGAG